MNESNQHLTLDEATKGIYISGNTRLRLINKNDALALQTTTYSRVPHPLDMLGLDSLELL